VRIVSSRIDPKRLSRHAGTLRSVQRFEQKAELAVRAGFGAWALRSVELEAYLAEGWTIDDVPRLNEAHGLTVSESGSLMQWQFTGGVPLLNAFQRPPGEGAGPLREIVSRVLGKGYAGYFVPEVLSQTRWREDPLAVAPRCHAGAMKVLAAA
jgi:hypothetical protein